MSTTGLAKRINRTRRITGNRLRELEKSKIVGRIRVENKTKPHIWFLINPKMSMPEKFFHYR